MRRTSILSATLYALFALSGFSGLIYESIWSHYLKLFLGHAAYAQTLVLVIFMGGMTAGAWLVSRCSSLIRQPLLIYCLVEAALGLSALKFDALFRGMLSLVFDTVVPAVGSPLAVDAVKWSLGGLIVFPQSVLLGATFPLISAGVLRFEHESSGRALAWLYFTNSLGAAVGVLSSGFYFVPTFGLPGTILTAGLINLVIALAVLLVNRRIPKPQDIPAAAVDPTTPTPRNASLLLGAALLTGAASFFYEVGWLRMLSMVLGSATHSFELMLAAFIFGLASGSFWVRGRIERHPDPLAFLGWIQLAMGSAAFLTIPLYNRTFDWMAALLSALQRNDTGYVAFNLAGQAICLALMLPVTFLAGTTLPLITNALVRGGAGEAGIGRVYAMNTLGSILGVLAAVHLVLPLLGLRQVVVCGAVIDLGLGLWLLSRRGFAGTRARLAVAGCLAVAFYITALVPFDVARMASGVFRFGSARTNAASIFHRDGKTATVDVTLERDGTLSLATNGKPDASTVPGGPPTVDEYPQVLNALLPLMARPDARRAAVIGIGSGRTTHALLLDPGLQSVETIEIEPAMIDGARKFGDFSSLAFDDPRSRIVIEDAKTHFARSRQQYDIIASEPSNPWVSGVASLFSAEFYGQIGRHLAPNGLLLQWIQLYEIDPPTLATAMNALGSQFDDYVVYAAADTDIIVLASPHGAVPELSNDVFRNPAMAQALLRIDIRSLTDMRIRRLGGKAGLAPLFRSLQRAQNSDYFPVLDQLAVKARFLKSDAAAILDVRGVSRRLEKQEAYEASVAPLNNTYQSGIDEEQAEAIPEYLEWTAGRNSHRPYRIRAETLSMLLPLEALNSSCDANVLRAAWLPAFREFAIQYLPYLSASGGQIIAQHFKEMKCYASAPAAIHDWVELLRSVAAEDWPAARGLEEALLENADQADTDFLQQELLLADIKGRGWAAARQTLSGFRRINPGSIRLRYLSALILANQDGGRQR